MKIVTTILMILGIVAIGVALTILTGFILFSLTPEMKSQITIGNISADALSNFDTKVDTFKKSILEATEAKQKKEFTLTLSEDEINSKIVQMLAEGSLPFKDLKISFNDNLLWAYTALQSEGANAKMGFIAKPEIVKKNIELRIIDFQLGRLPLPRSLDKRAEQLLNIYVKTQNPIDTLPVEIKTVEIANKQLIFKVDSIPAD